MFGAHFCELYICLDVFENHVLCDGINRNLGTVDDNAIVEFIILLVEAKNVIDNLTTYTMHLTDQSLRQAVVALLANVQITVATHTTLR
ncbi:hypothetical protein F444_04440 [Phytophthora nicotianae P1976]|uniref:Uncharacterized protein n=1 Tax=Phytophthora nicotianae P1976 TaxID=1317066 RepID=A0A081AQP0_PHYNI|nr:hypothetical protein F444_04440 [Phytophthora nicotianae P1976]